MIIKLCAFSLFLKDLLKDKVSVTEEKVNFLLFVSCSFEFNLKIVKNRINERKVSEYPRKSQDIAN